MNAGSATLLGNLRAWSGGLRRRMPRAEDESPLRAELFSAEQMQQYGKLLAASHHLSPQRVRDRLLFRLAENETVLLETCELLTAAVKANRRITPAAEWLLDNFYLIEEQVRTAKRHLPRDYSRELPRLAHGPSQGMPRVYDIALETIAHGDGRVDPESLASFVASYQTVTALTLGELWAIPIMLRLALIENLRRIAARLAAHRVERNRADYWAEQMLEVAEKDPKSLILVVADMARSGQLLVSAFVAEFARRLQGQSAALVLPLTWIEQQLAASGLTIEQLVQTENQQQAADQVSVSNSIGSLRFLGAMDWREFVETMSAVERVLREDSAGTYGRMEFATRDDYRHVIEAVARRSDLAEDAVARKALELASAAGPDDDDRRAHVGYYLVDRGLPRLEEAVGARLSPLARLRRAAGQRPLLFYLGAITMLSAGLAAAVLKAAQVHEWEIWVAGLVGTLTLLAASQLAVAMVNWLTTLTATPYPLARMDFSEGIPSESRTLVVVPTLLSSAENVDALSEALEVRFLANRDENLHFALLTDFPDALAETLPGDDALLQLAQQKIEELNARYCSTSNDVFFLFHRPRRWNPVERVWMGYERKRGKLMELNELLRGGAADRFSRIVGETAVLTNVKYVITLDTDTQLPRDAARQFAGAMAHPLNRARYDADLQRVCEGYGILQPRVAVYQGSSVQSRYARLSGSEPGIDPYTRAVSDVYQDLFGEGSFIGKGVYDVDVIERALRDRLPENRILSHDLIEGCYVRAGLLSDVQLYEEYPSRYGVDVARRHRWIRGDWQIAGWVMPRVPGPSAPSGGRTVRNPLSGLSRWKILDNLRRSLVPAVLTLLLVLGWTMLEHPGLWTLAVLGVFFIPVLSANLWELVHKPDDVLVEQHLRAVAVTAGRQLAHSAFTLACLPYEAYYSLDAIARTVWRMLVSRRRLLEWNPSSNEEANGAADAAAPWRAMWVAPTVAALTAAYLLFERPQILPAALPILGLWFAAPALAGWLSQPFGRTAIRLTAAQVIFLRKVARRTWSFFETFVGPGDHWLPPDNYQDHPVAVVAHRTSPTNIGLSLLANLSAYDFGYICAGELLDRTSRALEAMQQLERHRGHFYNWYDTQSLAPLAPKYVSTVDSGNLAAHLLVLRPGLLALADDAVLQARWFEGLYDSFRLVVDAAGAATPAAALAQMQRELEAARLTRLTTLAAARLSLERLSSSAAEVVAQVAATDTPESAAHGWADGLRRQCRSALDELLWLAPWLAPPAAAHLMRAFPGNDSILTLRELAAIDGRWLPVVEQRLAAAATPEEAEWLAHLHGLIALGSQRARERIAMLDRLAQIAYEYAQLDYGFLYDQGRNLLAIGYNVDDRRRDSSYYDLLASEARLCSFVGIAQGELPQESWFALGRLLTASGGEATLLSWSGSMFEYLMPLLVMPTYQNTLLDQTYHGAVQRQIDYARQRGVPWGISESGYNMVDVRLNYQYRAFGVPGLGLKTGLAEDLVIAPYASALALMVAPEQACTNLQRLAADGILGRHGFYEALDYTPARLPRGQSSAIVHSFMAHHQGMSLLALAYPLLGRLMQQRFESDLLFKATMLLLQERVPRETAFYAHTAELSDIHTTPTEPETPLRLLAGPDTAVPEVQLLSNGRYHVMVTNAGGGYSRWKDSAVTRWREDPTRDNWGTFCYVRDIASGVFWSTAHHPTLKRAEKYEAIFHEGRAELRRRDNDIETRTEIVVSPEDDIELRRIRIVNRARGRRVIEITSYAEVVLASADADALHPAFSNLFVQTEIVRERHAILCTRRPRSQQERALWMFHLMAVHGAQVGDVSYETDRMRFIGRGRTVAAPRALIDVAELSGTQGSVLDPIVAIRYRITLSADESATVDVVTGVGDTREACLGLIEKHQDLRLADRVFELAWTHSQVVLRQINASEADAQLYARLANSIVYANPLLRADPGILSRNRRGQSGLWAYAISGDLPIVLLQIKDAANIDLVRQLVQAHAYWRLKGLVVDLVIWNEDHAGYRQVLHDQIMGLIAAGVEANVMDRPGGIFVRYAEQISSEDRILLQSAARVILTDGRGSLAEQVARRVPVDMRAVNVPRLEPVRSPRADLPVPTEMPQRELILANDHGGFTPDGREYVITTTHANLTPAPWVNVLANRRFGTVVSESGQAYTWSENAHEFRLTPWHNDPVTDAGGEAFYLRDEESGHFWCPTPLPRRGAAPYVTRHGFGYSVFEHTENGISSELWTYVALDAPLKFSVLKVRNASGRARRLSVTGYVEWVLGGLPHKSAMHVITEIDSDTGALRARNPYSTEFPEHVAFFHTDDTGRTLTGDRAEFLGRNGTLQNPAAMARARLSGRVGAGMDPCAALQVAFDLADGQEREIVFRLGAGRDAADASQVVHRFRNLTAARNALDAVSAHWRRALGGIQVETPDPALDVLANGWLTYQIIACRFWGRSGYYQSGGAFGFRDQLQDAMALLHTEPALLREHLLVCAARQFQEGDVQHWWHPPSGRGVRTHCSDDFLWLPLATCRYVLGTGDSGVLFEPVHFVEGRPVSAEEDSYYDLPVRSGNAASLYQHCVRAILRGLTTGEHGLPLIGGGDWNDGMNLVGKLGKGESVWLAFFMYEVLTQFAAVARLHQDPEFAERCTTEAQRLRHNIEAHGWDGEWYRRAYFDDGTPLGSAANPECQIDAIAQSWSVLSGAADPERARRAMAAVDARLVRREHALIQLLDPPFDKSDLDPGYIKGYVPGVRENGGQYTHGAIWTVMAFAAQGDSKRAWELMGMINPVNHGSSAAAIAIYKVEPYVVAADVYAVSPHVGRGGWTWYTGSAGWLYRLAVESLLGLRLEVDKLRFEPCLPAHWERFSMRYRYRETLYRIAVVQARGEGGEPPGSMTVTVDGALQPARTIPLVDDHQDHTAEVRITRAAA